MHSSRESLKDSMLPSEEAFQQLCKQGEPVDLNLLEFHVPSNQSTFAAFALHLWALLQQTGPYVPTLHQAAQRLVLKHI